MTNGIFDSAISTTPAVQATNTATGSGIGVDGKSTATSGIGVYGETTGSSGVGVKGSGSLMGIEGFGGTYGVYGVPGGNNGYGIYGTTSFTGGAAIAGFYTDTVSTNPACAIYGHSSNSTYGTAILGEGGINSVLGKNYSQSGKAIFGWSDVTSSAGYGVYGYSTATSANHPGAGVYGYGFTGVWGDTSLTSGTGVYASASGTGSIAIYAINNGGAGVAAYLNGTMYVSGYITKAGGGFSIDHPLDPENKILTHGFVEAPEMTNIYKGKSTFDQDGNSTVNLPDYFEIINSDFNYNLTAVGCPMPNIHVSKEIENNSFVVSGGVHGKSFCWLISATRSDDWAKKNSKPTIENKCDNHKGKYMHPYLFGKDESMSIHPKFASNKEK